MDLSRLDAAPCVRLGYSVSSCATLGSAAKHGDEKAGMIVATYLNAYLLPGRACTARPRGRAPTMAWAQTCMGFVTV